MQQIVKYKSIKVIGLLLALVLVIALVLGACTSEEEPTEEETVKEEEPAEETVKEEDSGNYVHKGLVTGEVGDNVYSNPPPGQSTKLPREYPGAPPLIPHSLDGLVIDKDNNSCLGCHLTGITLGEDHTATMIPESHYTDAVSGEVMEDVVEARYVCNLCHLPQTDDEVLVDN